MSSPTDEPDAARGGRGTASGDGTGHTGGVAGGGADTAAIAAGGHSGDTAHAGHRGASGGKRDLGTGSAILHVVLYQPQIPQNTGNIARTCAAVGAELHLVEPLGFSVTESAVRRAGLDYWPEVTVHRHAGLQPVLGAAGAVGGQLVLLSTHGTRPYTQVRYRQGAYLLFGNETAGLPAELRARYETATARIPMRRGLRSLNLANAVAVVVYEALRQLDAPGLT